MLAVSEAIDNFTVTREKRASAYNMPEAHYHDHYEIYFLLSGKVRYFIDDKVFDLSEGDIVLIPPHIIHKTATLESRGAERILIAFTANFIMRRPAEKIFACFGARCFRKPGIEELVLSAEYESALSDPYSEELIAGYIREILIKLTRIYDKDLKPEGMSVNPFVEEAVHYISDNFSGDITLSALAEKAAMSASHFSRMFKAYTGFGVSEYITLVRIKNAEILLLTGDITVTEAAARCGFNSSSYFTSVFRKVRGFTPKKLRT